MKELLAKPEGLELPVPMWNKPYDPTEMCYLQEEVALLLGEPELIPVDGNRFWEYGRVLNFCHNRLPSPSEILDVGGAGSTLPAAVSCLGHRVTVLDVNSEGADKVAHFRSVGFTGVSWRYGRAEDLPYLDQSLDCVMCISTLEHLPDDHPALVEMIRILKPNGYLILSFDFVKEERPPTRHQARFYTQASIEELISRLAASGLRPVEPYDYSYAGEHIRCFGDPDSVYNGAMLICQSC